MKRSEFIGNKNKIRKPFPWAGSKVRVAPVIMELLHGDGWAKQHIEPFVGGNACLMHMPLDGVRVMLNDFDGKITNLWRCLKYKPIELAQEVTGVINTINMTCWDIAIQRGYDAMLDRLHADIDYCDVRLAAYYLDLMANWIGDNAGNTTGPWHTVVDEDGYAIMVRGVSCQQSHSGSDMGVQCKQTHSGSDRGVSCKQPQSSNDRGVSCKQPQISSDMGVSCQQTHSGSDRGVSRQQTHSGSDHTEWFTAISNRLSNAKILSHDWEKILNMSNITSKRTAIMFDPPYNKAGNNGCGIKYMNEDADSISDNVRTWIITNIEALKGTRIVVCGRGVEQDQLLAHGFTKIKGVNVSSLAKKQVDENTQEYLWYKPNVQL